MFEFLKGEKNERPNALKLAETRVNILPYLLHVKMYITFFG